MSISQVVKGLVGKLRGAPPADTVFVQPLVQSKNIEEPVHDGASLAEIVSNQAPPVELGIPVLSLDELMATQRELIDKLQTIGELDTNEFRALVLPVIQRFAAFVHLLPASENYHHHGTGGLLNHSLDVALRAGRMVSNKYLQQPGFSPSRNNAIKTRWPYAAMLAGLCHDLAKPFADFEVTDMDMQRTWDPFSETLLEWAQREKIRRYRYTWNQGRYGKHEQMAGGLVHHVLTPEFLSWLREAGSTITYPLFQVIAYGSASPKRNALRAVVMEADQRSTITDVHRWQEARKEIGMKVKMERYLLNIIKEQILSDDWTVNEVDSIVWVIEGDVFLEWKEAAAFLIYKLDELELNGLPSTPAAIADLLIKTDIALQNLSNPNRPRRLWDISIPITSRDGMEIEVRKQALRFVSADYVLDRFYESLPGARILKTPANSDDDADIIDTSNDSVTASKDAPTEASDTPSPARESSAKNTSSLLSDGQSPGTANNKAFAFAAQMGEPLPDSPATSNRQENNPSPPMRKPSKAADEAPTSTEGHPITDASRPFGGQGAEPTAKKRRYKKTPAQDAFGRQPKKAHNPALEKALLSRLRRPRHVERLVRNTDEGLSLVFPDGFLGTKSPAELKSMFIDSGMVRQTDSEKYYPLRSDLAETISGLLDNNKSTNRGERPQGRGGNSNGASTVFPSMVQNKQRKRDPKKRAGSSGKTGADNDFTHTKEPAQ